MQPTATKFIVGDRVKVDGYQCKGKVRWVGQLLGQGNSLPMPMQYIGVELDEPVGQNDGKSDHGQRMFKGKPSHCIFVVPEKAHLQIVRVRNKPIPDMPGIKVDERCSVPKYKCSGTIRWTGCVPTEKTYKVGVELDKQLGEFSGVAWDRFNLFQCPKNFGVLVRPEEVTIAPKGLENRKRGTSIMDRGLKIGDWVKIDGYSCLGQVRWLGTLDGERIPIPRCGLELLEPVGRNNGTVKGQKLFNCPPNFGLVCTLTVVHKTDVSEGQGGRSRASTTDGTSMREKPSVKRRVRRSSVGSPTSDGLAGFGFDESDDQSKVNSSAGKGVARRESFYMNLPGDYPMAEQTQDTAPNGNSLETPSSPIYQNVGVALSELEERAPSPSSPVSSTSSSNLYQNLSQALNDSKLSDDVEGAAERATERAAEKSESKSESPVLSSVASPDPNPSSSSRLEVKSISDRTSPMSPVSSEPDSTNNQPEMNKREEIVWNCLELSREQALTRLLGASRGHFVIRASTSSYAALTMIDQTRQIYHKRIFEEDGAFCFEGSKKWFSNLEEFVKHYTVPHIGEELPCPLNLYVTSPDRKGFPDFDTADLEGGIQSDTSGVNEYNGFEHEAQDGNVIIQDIALDGFEGLEMEPEEIVSALSIDDWVNVSGYDCPGQVKWTGTLSSDPIPRVGIELADPEGTSDGFIEGQQLFTCKPLHGICVPATKVSVVERDVADDLATRAAAMAAAAGDNTETADMIMLMVEADRQAEEVESMLKDDDSAAVLDGNFDEADVDVLYEAEGEKRHDHGAAEEQQSGALQAADIDCTQANSLPHSAYDEPAGAGTEGKNDPIDAGVADGAEGRNDPIDVGMADGAEGRNDLIDAGVVDGVEGRNDPIDAGVAESIPEQELSAVDSDPLLDVL